MCVSVLWKLKSYFSLEDETNEQIWHEEYIRIYGNIYVLCDDTEVWA